MTRPRVATYYQTYKPVWRNGRRDGLKIRCPSRTCGFKSLHRYSLPFILPYKRISLGVVMSLVVYELKKLAVKLMQVNWLAGNSYAAFNHQLGDCGAVEE